MRRAAFLLAVLVMLALPWAASGTGGTLNAYDHGPDPAAVDRGAEAPGPAGGSAGKPVSRAAQAKLSGGGTRFRLPTGWCGTPSATDNKQNEVDNGAYRYHAIYAIAADGQDRFAQLADSLQADAFQASGLLEQTYGRAIRMDMGTTCGGQYLDISIVRLPQTTVELERLAPTATGTLQAVSDGIDAAGFHTIRPNDTIDSASGRDRNFVVWIDAPAPQGACGQATSYNDQSRDQSNLNNLGGKVAVVFPNGNGGFCSSNTVRHEIGHNLGALQPTAPHAFDGAHCNDAYEDTMCYSNSPHVGGGQRGQFFDYGNDDYWDPPSGQALPWWTANLNRFLCPDAACNVATTGDDAIALPPDADGDGVADAEDVCPQVADANQLDSDGDGRGDACTRERSLRNARKPTVKMKARRAKKGWKVALTARGEGKALVTLRCRRTANGKLKTVLSKRTKLPGTVRANVRCATKPRPAIKQS
jgi:hypothetical protein